MRLGNHHYKINLQCDTYNHAEVENTTIQPRIRESTKHSVRVHMDQQGLVCHSSPLNNGCVQ